MRSLFVLLLCAFTSQLMAEKMDSVGITKINGKFHIRYMVSPGETIYRISTKFKVGVSDLMEINPDLEFGLKTGQVINIPYNPEAATPPPPAATVVYPKAATTTTNTDSLTESGVVHTIQPGETYSSLSRKYNISIEELLKINKVELKPGQRIVVNDKLKKSPEPSAKPASSPAKSTEPAVAAEPKKQVAEPVAVAPQKVVVENNDEPSTAPLEPIEYENKRKHLLVIPFDPYLYFSDADDEIASVSKMQRTKVRQAFRRRLNALLEPKGYETIHLLGGKAKDSITDLNKIYSSVGYSYQSIMTNPNARKENDPDKGLGKEKKQNQVVNLGDNSRAAQAQDSHKYFGVRVGNPELFTYFNNKYKIDYYLFINQFEVKTNFENCLDRATLNYERGFTIHYSIFDKTGKQIAGNRVYIDYNSNSNQISKILADNMQRVADKIMSDIPPAE